MVIPNKVILTEGKIGEVKVHSGDAVVSAVVNEAGEPVGTRVFHDCYTAENGTVYYWDGMLRSSLPIEPGREVEVVHIGYCIESRVG